MKYKQFMSKSTAMRYSYLKMFCITRYGKDLAHMTDDEVRVGYANMALYFYRAYNDKGFFKIVKAVLETWGFNEVNHEAVEFFAKKQAETGMPLIPEDIQPPKPSKPSKHSKA